MPLVEVNVRLYAPVHEVWSLLRDLSNYPRLMEPVHALDIIEDGADWTIAEWEVELKGSMLKWIEREERFPQEYKINFQQISGDLEKFEGYWKLESLSSLVTQASLKIDFEIGIPMLKDMLEPIAEKALRENAKKMLLSLAPEFETSTTT